MNFIRIQNTLINLSLVEEVEVQSRVAYDYVSYYPVIDIRFPGRQELFVLESIHNTSPEAVQAAIDYLTKTFDNHNESSSAAP